MTTVAKRPVAAVTVRAAGFTHAAAWVLGLAAARGATTEVGDTHAEITTVYADAALTALAAAACTACRHGTLLRRWEVVIGWVLAATITASGIGYLRLSTA